MSGRSIRVRGTAGYDPLYHLTAYGLRNPVVAWCIENGVYDEFCGFCRGKGTVGSGSCLCRDEHAIHDSLCDTGCRPSSPCVCCRRTCPVCHGRKLQSDRPPCLQDVGDKESLAFALALGITVDEDPRTRQLR